MARAVKRSAPNMVTSASGGFFNPDTCEKVLEDGEADMIAMARSFISNRGYLDIVREQGGRYSPLSVLQQMPYLQL